MLEYLPDYFIVWLIGFLPLLGIYIAIPIGFFLGLDPYTIAFFAILGTYFPIPLIIMLFDYLYSFSRIKKIIWRFYSRRFVKVINKHGMWLLLLVAPLIGAWTVGITGRLLRISPQKLALYSLLGMILYGVVLTLLIHFGITALTADTEVLKKFGKC